MMLYAAVSPPALMLPFADTPSCLLILRAASRRARCRHFRDAAITPMISAMIFRMLADIALRRALRATLRQYDSCLITPPLLPYLLPMLMMPLMPCARC